MEIPLGQIFVVFWVFGTGMGAVVGLVVGCTTDSPWGWLIGLLVGLLLGGVLLAVSATGLVGLLWLGMRIAGVN